MKQNVEAGGVAEILRAEPVATPARRREQTSAFRVPVEQARATLPEAVPVSNGFDFTRPPRTFGVGIPVTRRRYELRRAMEEPMPDDLIEISQKLAAILLPAVAFGSVAGLIAAFSEGIPVVLSTFGSGIALLGKAFIASLAYPPAAIAVGSVLLLSIGAAIGNENKILAKAGAHNPGAKRYFA